MSNARDAGSSELTLVDSDIHIYGWEEAVNERLPDHYRKQKGVSIPSKPWTNPNPAGAKRQNAFTDSGFTGSDPELLLEHHVEPTGIDYCVLNGSGIHFSDVAPNADYASNLTRAYNNVLVEDWLSVDDRFVGSMVVSPQSPERAAEEIRRIGDQPRIVQVLMSSASGLGCSLRARSVLAHLRSGG